LAAEDADHGNERQHECAEARHELEMAEIARSRRNARRTGATPGAIGTVID
jgi:hypothetical protein